MRLVDVLRRWYDHRMLAWAGRSCAWCHAETEPGEEFCSDACYREYLERQAYSL